MPLEHPALLPLVQLVLLQLIAELVEPVLLELALDVKTDFITQQLLGQQLHVLHAQPDALLAQTEQTEQQNVLQFKRVINYLLQRLQLHLLCVEEMERQVLQLLVLLVMLPAQQIAALVMKTPQNAMFVMPTLN